MDEEITDAIARAQSACAEALKAANSLRADLAHLSRHLDRSGDSILDAERQNATDATGDLDAVIDELNELNRSLSNALAGA